MTQNSIQAKNGSCNDSSITLFQPVKIWENDILYGK